MGPAVRWLGAHRGVLLSLVAGALGYVLVWGALHLWEDHQALHQLIQIEIQRQQALQRMQQQQQPAPQATPQGQR